MMQNNQNPLLIFKQFGFSENRITNDGHSVGNCPFCGKADHFFINTQSANKTWDCKVCGKGGGFKTFLNEIHKHSVKCFNNDEEAQEELKQSRSLKVETFKKLNVGYLPEAGIYTVPVFSREGGKLLNLKIYDKKSFKNAAGCLAAMYGQWLVPEHIGSFSDVYITEGEWDTMCMLEILDKLKIVNAAVIGVPGAGTFKQDVFPLLLGKNVHLLYDNDQAGKNGAEKACAILSTIAAKVDVIEWNGFPDGFDVRDLYKKNMCSARNTLDKITSFLKPSTFVPDTGAAHIPEYTGERVDCKEVYEVFTKWLHMPDTTLIDVVFGTVLANRLPGDPLWMFIVAPPGGTKTEPLISMSGGAGIEMLSSLTPHTLISGSNINGGPDPSLVPALNGKILLIKDFTTILGLPSMERDEIISILRDVYDGECAKAFGNGVIRRYKSKFGIIAATTPIIEQMTEEHAQLGERFLRWRNWIPEKIKARRPYIEKALSNATKEVELRTELNSIAKRVLLGKYEHIPSMSRDMEERVIALSQWTSMMRGTVSRDKFTKEILFKSFTELGTRLCKQFLKLLRGIAMFRGEKTVSESTYAICVTVARASCSQRYLDAVDGFIEMDYTKSHTTLELQKHIGLPSSTCATVLTNLEMLGIISREITGGKSLWVLDSEMYELMERCKVIKGMKRQRKVELHVTEKIRKTLIIKKG